MTTYSAPDGTKIDLDPATVKMFDALAFAAKKPVKDLAAEAVELLRLATIVTEKKTRKTSGS
jgi:hypothetical protein